jgi:hypothetical protein
VREDRLGDGELREHVALEELVQVVLVELEQLDHRALALVDGVVDEHVDAAEVVEGLLRAADERLAVEHVHLDGVAAHTVRLDRLDGGVEPTGNRDGRVGVDAAFAVLQRAGGDRDVVAGLGQLDRGGLADAPAGAGHECYPSSCHGRRP